MTIFTVAFPALDATPHTSRVMSSGGSNPGLEGSSPLAIFERDRKGSSP
jgi:hypothetical protein